MILSQLTQSFVRWRARRRDRIARQLIEAAVRSFDSTEHVVELRSVSGMAIPPVRIRINITVEGGP